MSMIRTLLLVFIFAFATATAACSMTADTTAAQVGVDKFHAMLESGQFAQIYAGSSDDMKKHATERQIVGVLSAVHSQLGAYRSTKQQQWKVNYDTKGTYITLSYKTTYAAGDADEQFMFLMQGETPTLAGYKVDSPLLK
jgi:Protein of unknown function (DUF3887)